MPDWRTPDFSNHLPGLHNKDHEGDSRNSYKSWEDWERGRRTLHDVFRWKTVNKQVKPVLPASVEREDLTTSNSEQAKSARGKAKKLDTACREEVDEVVLKVLQRSSRSKTSKKKNKEAVKQTKKTVWRGIKEVVSEAPVASKAQKRAEKERRLAEVRYFFQLVRQF